MIRTGVATLISCVLLAGCITPPPPTHNPPPPVDMRGGLGGASGGPSGDYAGCSSLIPIYAETTGEGVAREEAWVSRNYPGARIVSQQTTRCGEAMVDVITLALPDGGQRTVWFDISSFFGKTDSGDLDSMLEG